MKKMTIVAILAAGALSLMAAPNGKALAQKCSGCHGSMFQKKALGVSKIVKNMTKDEIVKALEGYKAGTFGGPMKGVMKGQVATYTTADIKAVAKYIKSHK